MGTLWEDLEKRGSGYHGTWPVLLCGSPGCPHLWVRYMGAYCVHAYDPKGSASVVQQRNSEDATTKVEGGEGVVEISALSGCFEGSEAADDCGINTAVAEHSGGVCG